MKSRYSSELLEIQKQKEIYLSNQLQTYLSFPNSLQTCGNCLIPNNQDTNYSALHIAKSTVPTESECFTN